MAMSTFPNKTQSPINKVYRTRIQSIMVFAPLQQLDKSRKDVTAGMSLVALAFTIRLVWLGLKIKQRNKDSPDK